MGSNKKCACVECTREIIQGLLMCREHWKSVPIWLQRRIYNEWTKFRMDSTHLPYFEHVAQAIEGIANREKKTGGNWYRKMATAIKQRAEGVRGQGSGVSGGI